MRARSVVSSSPRNSETRIRDHMTPRRFFSRAFSTAELSKESHQSIPAYRSCQTCVAHEGLRQRLAIR
eukprot:c47534_g1_i1 orf=84-287(+)